MIYLCGELFSNARSIEGNDSTARAATWLLVVGVAD